MAGLFSEVLPLAQIGQYLGRSRVKNDCERRSRASEKAEGKRVILQLSRKTFCDFCKSYRLNGQSEQLYVSEKKVHQITVEESVIVIIVMRYIQANDNLPEEISRQLH